MRFRTIWSLRGMPLDERLRRTRDWAAMEIGGHLPLRVRYWTTMREIAHATRDSRDIPATSLDEVLSNLRYPKVMS